MTEKSLRIAAFGGFRSIPPKAGGAGSDKFAVELYPRIAAKGHELIAYARIYPGETDLLENEYKGVKLKYFKTINKAGFDTLVHSFKATFDIILYNRAKYIHLHSGANSIWAIPLRLTGKKVCVTQFAMDWKRDKWPWYGKLFYLFSNYLTAHVPHKVVFDNIFTKEYFEKKYNKKFDFIPYGSEVQEPPNSTAILEKIGVQKGEYFLFVGRFIPDKGIHLLVKAFETIHTNKKLVLIGGSPNPSVYEKEIQNTTDERIIFPGYVYGEDTNILMKNAYAYIQPSLIEGLSPVILTVMGLGTPLICSNIRENLFITKEHALTFESGVSDSLKSTIENSLSNYNEHVKMAKKGKQDVISRFNWDKIADQYIEVLKN
jgi:glycosyltransferase involved in cell wall biosynthesis